MTAPKQLAQRLRASISVASNWPGARAATSTHAVLFSEAADEIERLSKDNDELRDSLHELWSGHSIAAENERLRTELEALRIHHARCQRGADETPACTCAMNLGPNAHKNQDCPVHAVKTKGSP